MRQTPAEALAKSRGCLTCHNGIEKMHQSDAVNLGCCDCHGGDPNATTKACAHVYPRFPERWSTSGTPQRTFALLNRENVVKTKLNDPTMAFLGTCDNPGDYRSSGCTSCHVLYANDRDQQHSAHIARYGNHGFSFSGDPSIPRGVPGHPIDFEFDPIHWQHELGGHQPRRLA